MKKTTDGLIAVFLLMLCCHQGFSQVVQYTYDGAGALELVFFETNTACTAWFEYDNTGNITNQIISGSLEDPDQNKDGIPDAWALVYYDSVSPDGTATPVATITPFPTATPTPSVKPTPIPVPTPTPGDDRSIMGFLLLLLSRL